MSPMPPTGRGENAPPAIDVTDLELTYDDGTTAVTDVSLTVPRGECFGFIGPNGAGKTTTISVLATLLSPTDGTARIHGYDTEADRRAVRATVGYMAQETSVDPELTARENLQFACGAYGVPADDRADRIADLLGLVDLTDVADTPAAQFSGGMQKRLDAATALVHDPALVFLDEPTTGLDPKARERLWSYVERINDRGTTVFLTTQYLREADRLCDRLAVIRDGSILTRGSPDALKRRVGGDTLVVDIDGDPDAAARAARTADVLGPQATVDATDAGLSVRTHTPESVGTDLLFALEAAGVSVTGFAVEEATLEDVFLAVADDETDSLDAPDAETTGAADADLAEVSR